MIFIIIIIVTIIIITVIIIIIIYTQVYFRNHIVPRPTILLAKALRLDTKTGVSRYF